MTQMYVNNKIIVTSIQIHAFRIADTFCGDSIYDPAVTGGFSAKGPAIQSFEDVLDLSLIKTIKETIERSTIRHKRPCDFIVTIQENENVNPWLSSLICLLKFKMHVLGLLNLSCPTRMHRQRQTKHAKWRIGSGRSCVNDTNRTERDVK